MPLEVQVVMTHLARTMSCERTDVGGYSSFFVFSLARFSSLDA